MLSLIDNIIPGTADVLLRRYSLLKEIIQNGPHGRRVLSEKLNVSERILRKDIDVLKGEKLLITSSAGTSITPLGKRAYQDLKGLIADYLEAQEKEQKLAEALNIDHTIIIPGNSVADLTAMEFIGTETIRLIDSLLPQMGKFTIAVMGGTTMSHLAKSMDKSLGEERELLFIPARGGLGESVEFQANTVASEMAKSTGGRSQMLHAPESVSTETLSVLLKEPEIKDTLEKLNNADLVLFSIGNAIEMAERRGLGTDQVDKLKNAGAIAEAFGEFVDYEGKILHKLSRVGLQSEDLWDLKNVVAIAGGREKSQAIEAYVKRLPPHTWLVTDEVCANRILNGD